MIRLKSATIDDAKFLFDLRNESSNRIMFKDTSSVKWDDHVRWLSDKLSRDDFFIFIAIDENENQIGQFRIDANCEVSVSLAEKFKGLGLGWEIIKIGSDAFKSRIHKELIADIKSENVSSLKAFRKAGYRFKENYMDQGQEYQRLIY